MPLYEKFDLDLSAKLALNYLTRMVDAENDSLPYWLIQITQAPAWAKHVRVDDAELVASWYEALWCVRRILGTDAGGDVLAGFRRHLFKHWGEHGLRFHEKYPWTHTVHHAFHEDAYILAALNRIIEHEGDPQAKQLAANLVRGLRSLVWDRKVRTFWSGDFPSSRPTYEFPNDVYLQDGGFDFTRFTGRGEEELRNGMMLHAVVRHWQLTGDEVSLDLARGLAWHLTTTARYFDYRGQFYGHVHSATWIAAGLVLLGRLTNDDWFLKAGKNIYRFVESISSSFGWVPEYAAWHPMGEEHCETCCIRDMILCGFEIIDAGDERPYDLINRYIRNQFYEQQIKDTSFVGADNSREPDEPGITYKDIGQRVLGGWSGGGEPNSISLTRFRSIAGCCIGTAPQALHQVWERVVVEHGRLVTVNFPIERAAPAASVSIGYPNEGWLEVRANRDADLRVRTFPFMGPRLALAVNGRSVPLLWEGACLKADGVKKGDVVRVSHPLAPVVARETAREINLEVTWQGCDVVDLAPAGNPLRLYQRELGRKKEVPPAPSVSGRGKLDARPTDQKR